jgi:hypothetical protein
MDNMGPQGDPIDKHWEKSYMEPPSDPTIVTANRFARMAPLELGGNALEQTRPANNVRS